MSEENVELIRATIGAFNRNDLDAAIAAMLEEKEEALEAAGLRE